MKKHNWIVFLLIVVLSLVLSACSAGSREGSAAAYAPPTEESNVAEEQSSEGPASSEENTEAAQSTGTWQEQPLLDEQGAIMVEITPLNLNAAGETLDFAVSLNTHSVDLSMDLASLAMLSTDAGLSVQASKWDAPSGGHHLSGTLSFPASLDNASLLSSGEKLTLTLANLDVPERIFVWEK